MLREMLEIFEPMQTQTVLGLVVLLMGMLAERGESRHQLAAALRRIAREVQGAG